MFNKKAIILLLATITLSLSIPSPTHLLSKFDHEFAQMHESIYKHADTSHAFSIAMKIMVGVEALKGDLEIEDSGFVS